MLTNTKHLKGLAIEAKDGEIGTVEQFYFDDETWAIRYLVVASRVPGATGGWLGLTGGKEEARQVLISPFSVTEADWQARRLKVALTKQQVEDSPGLDTHRPVSRQHEAELLGYYGYPCYWGGPDLWGPSFYPTGLYIPPTPAESIPAETTSNASNDSHLRSSASVTGYAVEAADGEIGHVDGFVMEDKSWAIRYIEVATRNWLPGKKVLLSPEWIKQISWEGLNVSVGLSRDSIRNAPEYVESEPITREYEDRLHLHYGVPPYWLNQSPTEA